MPAVHLTKTADPESDSERSVQGVWSHVKVNKKMRLRPLVSYIRILREMVGKMDSGAQVGVIALHPVPDRRHTVGDP